MEHSDLDLREILRILSRRLWIFVLLPLVAAITAAAVSVYVLVPVYSASTTLWVIKEGSTQINLNDVMLSRNLTKTYSEIAKSRAVLADVIKRLDLKHTTVSQLQARLTVTPVRDTEILSFTVEDQDPVLAANLADSIAESFQAQIRAYMNVQNVVVVDQAMVPGSPVRPKAVLNTAVAFVLGLMASLGLAFLLEYLDTTIKTPDDVGRYVGVPVLGVIPFFDVRNAELAQKSQRRSKQVNVVVQK